MFCKLNASLYGTCDAARNWGNWSTEVLQGLGFVFGKLPPRLFWNEERDMRSAKHVDDITTVGDDAILT